eukprot:m.137970 g.137970  ORF g.137970 m.137970 type:complete len:75 (-) comp12794_c0_seq1:71-295(-)
MTVSHTVALVCNRPKHSPLKVVQALAKFTSAIAFSSKALVRLALSSDAISSRCVIFFRISQCQLHNFKPANQSE